MNGRSGMNTTTNRTGLNMKEQNKEDAAMSSDLQRFLRAVKTIAKLAWKYPDEAFLEALGRYATVQQEDDVGFVGEFLDEIGRELSKRRVRPCCRQCDKEICDDVRYDDRNPRADAQYCGPRCASAPTAAA